MWSLRSIVYNYRIIEESIEHNIPSTTKNSNASHQYIYNLFFSLQIRGWMNNGDEKIDLRAKTRMLCSYQVVLTGFRFGSSWSVWEFIWINYWDNE